MIVENKFKTFRLHAFSYFEQSPLNPKISAFSYSGGSSFSFIDNDGLEL